MSTGSPSKFGNSSSPFKFGNIGKDGAVEALQQLFLRLEQEINEQQPPNVIYFIIEFLCRHYPSNLGGFAELVADRPELERDRLEVVYFLRCHQIPMKVASAFLASGYDTLDSLEVIRDTDLIEIESRSRFGKWLPGHKLRLQQLFERIDEKIVIFREIQRQFMFSEAQTYGPHLTYSANTYGATGYSSSHTLDPYLQTHY